MPAEYRLYRIQPSIFKMRSVPPSRDGKQLLTMFFFLNFGSRACILFILVRYMSIIALVTSNWGFFGKGFSASLCRHYQLVAPLTKRALHCIRCYFAFYAFFKLVTPSFCCPLLSDYRCYSDICHRSEGFMGPVDLSCALYHVHGTRVYWKHLQENP
jgi:hypothetical protein